MMMTMDSGGLGAGQIHGLAHQPALVDGTDFVLLQQVDGRRYPALKRCLTETRKHHVARAVRQHPLLRCTDPSMIYGVRAQLDARVDYGLGGGCGFQAILAPDCPAHLVLGNLGAPECGVSLYRFSVKALEEGYPAQLHNDARHMVQDLFEKAITKAVERSGCSGEQLRSNGGSSSSESGGGFAGASRYGDLQLHKEGGGVSPPSDHRICSWSDKESVRWHLECMQKHAPSPSQLFLQGLFVPPVQPGYVDGGPCRFAVYALNERLSDNEFLFALMVDGGSELAGLALRNAANAPSQPSAERLRHDFEAVREYNDLARDAQAHLLLSWMSEELTNAAGSLRSRWTLNLPDRKFFNAGHEDIYFSQPFVVNHYNTLQPLAEAVRGVDEHGRPTGSMMPPNALQLYKSLQLRAARASGAPHSPSVVLQMNPLNGVGGGPSAALPLPATTTVALESSASDSASRRRLRELLEAKKMDAGAQANAPSSTAPPVSAVPPSHPLYQRVSGRLAPQPSHQPTQPALARVALPVLSENPRALAFFHQCTAAGASSGGLVLQAPGSQTICLFVASCKVDTKALYDVVRSSPQELAASGVYSPDKRCDALPNLDLVHTQGAFPRSLPTGLADLRQEAELRAFPHVGPQDPEEDARLTEAVNYLAGQPFVQQVVNRVDKVCCFVQTHTFSCLAMHCEPSLDTDEQREQRQPWALALHRQFASADGSAQTPLRGETLERREFLRASVEYMCSKPGVRSEFFAGDHYIVRTSSDFLAELIADRLPQAYVQPPGQFQGSAPPVQRPIHLCVDQHFRDGTPLPSALWDVLGDETQRRLRILPDLLSLENMHRALASWTY